MALIAVLWIVAALSVLAIGVTHTVRQQIQVASTQRDQVEGQALGEAAIALTLQEMQASPERPSGIVSVEQSYAGVFINVQVAPLDGLISLNGADPELLAAVLDLAGGLPPSQAEQLALMLVEWREARPELDLTVDAQSRTQARGFEAVEDLLLVPGFDYDLYARVAPLFSADLEGARGVNLEAAPPSVLSVLAGGDAGRVQTYLQQRGRDQLGTDTSGFNAAFSGGRGSELYRLHADVPLQTGKILRMTQDVALGEGYSNTAPWRVLQVDRQIVPAS